MNVLEVNKTDYESCNSDLPLHNWTTGAGRDVVPLNGTGHYYFISGKGFCYSGMKLSVRVENLPPPPSASPIKEKSASPCTSPPPSASPIKEKSASPCTSPLPSASPIKEMSAAPSTAPPSLASPIKENSAAPITAPAPLASPIKEKSAGPNTASPPLAPPLEEKSAAPSIVYKAQLVLPAVFAIGTLWDAFVRFW